MKVYLIKVKAPAENAEDVEQFTFNPAFTSREKAEEMAEKIKELSKKLFNESALDAKDCNLLNSLERQYPYYDWHFSETVILNFDVE